MLLGTRPLRDCACHRLPYRHDPAGRNGQLAEWRRDGVRNVTVNANASDNMAVAGVQFFVDGAPLGAEDTSAPYSATWNTTTAANGSHALTARARDGAGNTTTSSAVTVTVANGAGSNVRIEDGNTAILYPARGTSAILRVRGAAAPRPSVSASGSLPTSPSAELASPGLGSRDRGPALRTCMSTAPSPQRSTRYAAC